MHLLVRSLSRHGLWVACTRPEYLTHLCRLYMVIVVHMTVKTKKIAEIIHFNLTVAVYPNHICCKVYPPQLSKLYPLRRIRFTFNSSFSGFSVYMADKLTSSFNTHKANMMGDKIVSRKKGEFISYKVQILEDEKLEETFNLQMSASINALPPNHPRMLPPDKRSKAKPRKRRTTHQANKNKQTNTPRANARASARASLPLPSRFY